MLKENTKINIRPNGINWEREMQKRSYDQFEDQLMIIHSILYILDKLPEKKCDLMKLFKLLFLAELEHLRRYGFRATGDAFIKMKNGPVPSLTYDMLKGLREDTPKLDSEIFSEYERKFKLDSHFIVEKVGDFDSDEVTGIFLKSIDAVLEEYGDKSGKELSDISHHYNCWKNARQNAAINNDDIALDAGLTHGQIEYRKELETLFEPA